VQDTTVETSRSLLYQCHSVSSKDACLLEHSGLALVLFFFLGCRYIDMAERLCQKRALEAFRLDTEKWGGKILCTL
jgi:hypothetical protein